MKNVRFLVVGIMSVIVMAGCGNSVGEGTNEDITFDKSMEASVEESIIESKDEGMMEIPGSSKEPEIESVEENVFSITGKWYMMDVEGAYIEFFEDNVAVMCLEDNSEKCVVEYKIDEERKVVVLYDAATNEELEVNIVEENGRIILQNEYDTCVHEDDYKE